MPLLFSLEDCPLFWKIGTFFCRIGRTIITDRITGFNKKKGCLFCAQSRQEGRKQEKSGIILEGSKFETGEKNRRQ